jgi:seryl-tRNA synthetase
MIDIKRIREDPKGIERAVRKKGATISIEKILELDEKRRRLISEADIARAEQNAASAKIPQLKGVAKEDAIAKLKEIKLKIAALESKIRSVEEELELLLYKVPNPPLEGVPEGKDEHDNVVLREVGSRPLFDFQPKDYLTLAQALDIIDVERAGKVSGSRFGYLKGDGALLEFALLQFGVSTLTNEKVLQEIIANNNLNLPPRPFIPIIPPVLIRPEMLGRMGYLNKNSKGKNLPQISERSEARFARIPTVRDGTSQSNSDATVRRLRDPRNRTRSFVADGFGKNSKLSEWEGEEVYFLRDDDLVLVGTSEQSIGPMHANEIFNESDLPLRYLGFSSCFRREAGSYGKDTKGILRVHQFDKLEMFSFCRPEDSEKEHKFLLACEEYLMAQLKIPYRVINICTGDLGAPAAAKYDIEAWLPGQNEGRGEYRETHSTSNTTDFQARRLNIRCRLAFKGQMSDIRYVHMLNGTALAMGRMIIAIIENYQTKEGKVIIPEVLRQFMNKEVMG